MPLPKGSGVMPIPILSQKSPNLAIVDWCLIATQEVSIGTLPCPHDLDDVCPDGHLLSSY